MTENSSNDYRVCVHLLEAEDGGDYWQYFTGIGKNSYLICGDCYQHPETWGTMLQSVDKARFDGVWADGYWNGIAGRPEVRFEPAGLAFEHRWVDFPEFQADPLWVVQPLPGGTGSIWIGVTAGGVLVRIDCDMPASSVITKFSSDEFDLGEALELVISPDGAWAAVANERKLRGVVVDLNSGRRTMSLQRDNYHTGHCVFPLAFGIYGNRALLVHGTGWNRVDVSDPATGELLTPRKYETPPEGQSRPEHYLDYFHGRLTISPDQTWIADDGWVWHPVGITRVWNFRRWVEENVWESEDGCSRKGLAWIDYFWNVPMCWVDDQTLAIWGYGGDDEWMIPAARLFDVSTGALKDWFPGPETARSNEVMGQNQIRYSGAFFFDRYLFSVSGRYGIGVWDVARGVGLLIDASFAPIAYHAGTREFLTLRPEGRLQLSRLKG